MAFNLETKSTVDGYVRKDLDGGVAEHIDFFSFLSSNPDLQERVGEEYFSARYLYKLMEGLRVGEQWSDRAQIQIQVQQYASIYEACLHHLLFESCPTDPRVTDLLRHETLKVWNVSADLQSKLSNVPGANGRQVVAAIGSTIKIKPEKVRFEHKAQAAADLGIINAALAKELKAFYAARNMIHIHAELKRGASWQWQIDFGKQAYWRLSKFRDQVLEWQANRGDATAT